MQDESIAAISTPPGTGGIALIRLSGPEALEIADKVFRGKVRVSSAESRRAYLGEIVAEEGTVLDQVLLSVFRRPNSYTAEDVVEISCHGGSFLSRRILELVIKSGARLARPGEFTERAFLGGKLDLSQAEAVADIIRAKSDASLKSAQSQFQGFFSRRVKKLRRGLLDICSLLELELDFAEEDVEFVSRREVLGKIEEAACSVNIFLQSYKQGRLLREGVKLVIAGAPNVGKSTLLNALLRSERAIVTDIPGTTRDALEEHLSIQGVFFRVTDTAGVRETTERIESIGVKRSWQEIRDADIVLLLFDGSMEFNTQELELLRAVLDVTREKEQQQLIAVLNKSDLGVCGADQLAALLGRPAPAISAKTGVGLENLESKIVETAMGEDTVNLNEAMVSTVRQKDCLERAIASLSSARKSLESGISSEFVAADLRHAVDSLSGIIGEVSTEDILGSIFSEFCIGK